MTAMQVHSKSITFIFFYSMRKSSKMANDESNEHTQANENKRQSFLIKNDIKLIIKYE